MENLIFFVIGIAVIWGIISWFITDVPEENATKSF